MPGCYQSGFPLEERWLALRFFCCRYCTSLLFIASSIILAFSGLMSISFRRFSVSDWPGFGSWPPSFSSSFSSWPFLPSCSFCSPSFSFSPFLPSCSFSCCCFSESPFSCCWSFFCWSCWSCCCCCCCCCFFCSSSSFFFQRLQPGIVRVAAKAGIYALERFLVLPFNKKVSCLVKSDFRRLGLAGGTPAKQGYEYKEKILHLTIVQSG